MESDTGKGRKPRMVCHPTNFTVRNWRLVPLGKSERQGKTHKRIRTLRVEELGFACMKSQPSLGEASFCRA